MKNLITSRLTAFLCAAVMVLGLTACGAKITGLSLPAGAVLEKGETLQMDLQYDTETQADADALAEAAEKLELVWTSDDETVATVDENGLDARSTLCSDRCRKASRKAAKRQFDGRAKGKDYEQAYDREYMFWYNRITKLKKAGAPPEQIGRAQAALKEFRKEALLRKQQVKEKKLPANQFISWMIGQETVIEGICQE